MPGEDLTGRTLLGKLRVVRQLGAGGMGVVYEVEHLLTKHRRALKVLHAEVALEHEAVVRFVREASVAGRLSSPRVVETFDAGQLEDGAPYVLMELLVGESLARRIAERGTLPVAEAATIAVGVCEALVAAHAAGIVHRDLKPDNVFLVRAADGGAQVKVLDFGISKFAASLTDGAPRTETGIIMGTPHYMSPEQAAGPKNVDARADLYAVGVMLYECVAGERPFDAETLAALIVRVYTGQYTPLAERVPGIDPAFAALVTRAMSLDPAQRPQSASELLRELTPFASGAKLSVHPAARVVTDVPPRDTGEMRASDPSMAPTVASLRMPSPQRPIAVPPAPSRTIWWVVGGVIVLVAGGALVMEASSDSHSALTPTQTVDGGPARDSGADSGEDSGEDRVGERMVTPILLDATVPTVHPPTKVLHTPAQRDGLHIRDPYHH